MNRPKASKMHIVSDYICIDHIININSSKTEFLIIGLKQQLSKIDNSSLNTTQTISLKDKDTQIEE